MTVIDRGMGNRACFEREGQAGVIVEFFGPPGAGKTTFSRALAARLRDCGCAVDAHFSARPGEERPASAPGGATIATRILLDPLRRLTRPIAELFAAISANPQAHDSSTDDLISKLPPGHRLAALRMRQYLIRLSAAWRQARNSDRIVIFDQGYAQAVSSILVTKGRILNEDVMAILAVAPRSDLAIRVDASIATIETRLKHRMQAIGPLGRLLESDLGDAETHMRGTDWLYAGMKQTGRAVLAVNSTDAEMLSFGVERAQSRIFEMRTRGAAE
jgi:hypothetical protein